SSGPSMPQRRSGSRGGSMPCCPIVSPAPLPCQRQTPQRCVLSLACGFCGRRCFDVGSEVSRRSSVEWRSLKQRGIISADVIGRRNLPVIEKIEHFGFVLPKSNRNKLLVVVRKSVRSANDPSQFAAPTQQLYLRPAFPSLTFPCS